MLPSPLSWLCLILLTTCSPSLARPSWSSGVVSLKDRAPPPRTPVDPQQYLKEAQFAASKVFQDAGEDAQLHMAIMKQKYMDIIRERFYHAFPSPHSKNEGLHHRGPTLNVEDVSGLQPTKNIPHIPLQPVYMHHTSENSPCSGNILNCLHAYIPPRFGKIVPSSSAGAPSCFGHNCNQVSFGPNYKPASIPKPSHTISSMNGKPLKRPQKHHHHIICDRKRPDQICNHRSTFWPTYATLKFTTKLYPLATTISTKGTSQSGMKEEQQTQQTPLQDLAPEKSQQHLTIPGKYVNTATNPTSDLWEIDDRTEIGTLRINSTKLENEILGIHEPGNMKSGIKVIQISSKTDNTVDSEATSSYESVSYSSTPNINFDNLSPTIDTSTTDTSTKQSFSNTEFNQDSQQLPLKSFVNFVQPTEKSNLHANDVIKEITQGMPKSIHPSEQIHKDQAEWPLQENPQTPSYNDKTQEDKTETTTVKLFYSQVKGLQAQPTISARSPETTVENNDEDITRMVDNELADIHTEDSAYQQPILPSMLNNNQKEPQSIHATVEANGELPQIIGTEHSFDAEGEDISMKAAVTMSSYMAENNDFSKEVNDYKLVETHKFIKENISYNPLLSNADNGELLEKPTEEPSFTLAKEEKGIPTSADNTLISTEEISYGMSEVYREYITAESILDSDRELELFETSTHTNQEEEDDDLGKQIGKKDAVKDSHVRVIWEGDVQSTHNTQGLNTILPTEEPNNYRSGTEISATDSNSVDKTSWAADFNNNIEGYVTLTETNLLRTVELSTQANNVPLFVGKEDFLGSATKYEDISKAAYDPITSSSSDEFEIPTNNKKVQSHTDDPLLQTTLESKINDLKMENNSFEYTVEGNSDLVTETIETIENLARANTPQIKTDPNNSEKKTNLDHTTTLKGEPFVVKATTGTYKNLLTQEVSEDTIFGSEEVTSEAFASDMSQVKDLKENISDLSFDNEGGSQTSTLNYNEISHKGATSNGVKEVLNPRENEEGQVVTNESPMLLEDILKTTTGELAEETTSPSLTENEDERNIEDTTVDEFTELPQLRENLSEDVIVSTTRTDNVKISSESIPVRQENVEEDSNGVSDTELAKILPTKTEGKNLESNLVLLEETIGKTDTPALLIGEDLTNQQTEGTSLRVLAQDYTTLIDSSTYGLNSKTEDNQINMLDVSPTMLNLDIVNTKGVNEGYDSTTFSYNEIKENVDSNRKSDYNSFENSTFSTTGDVEVTTRTDLPAMNPSLRLYQDGVLKFTAEIETEIENTFRTERIESSTDSASVVELKDNVKRKARSSNYESDEIKVYPTTECVLCMMGVTHSHRTPEENNQKTVLEDKALVDNQAKTSQSETSSSSNCSFNADVIVEHPETSSSYASTILELLPVIREGFRNNAFSEEDKKVIWLMFGDVKSVTDEDDVLRMTESRSDLFMGDETSRIDEIIEDTDYDSSERNADYISEEGVRLKRSKKNFQFVNELMKKMPKNLKGQFNVPTQVRNRRNIRSTQVSEAEAGAILALLAEKGEAVQLDIHDDEDEDEDEYEYYEDEGGDYGAEESRYIDVYEDDYDKPSFGELIKLARKHRERKARAEQS